MLSPTKLIDKGLKVRGHHHFRSSSYITTLTMAGQKHALDEGEMDTPNVSPFMSMFEDFRKELDEHQDRRERIIKASRDITALSKKM